MTVETHPFSLMDLPFEYDALEPAISQDILRFHYDKHHKGYVDNLNKLVKGTMFEEWSLEDIISSAKGPLYNNAAQVWNHDFYWKSLRPFNENNYPPEDVETLISKYWDTFANFKAEFEKKGAQHFGSGWVWLCQHPDGSLFTYDSHDAHNPLNDPLVNPLMVVDLWEHAYYLQYKNDRKAYLSSIWTLINWDFVLSNIER